MPGAASDVRQASAAPDFHFATPAVSVAVLSLRPVARSMASGVRTAASFERDVNEHWMEAIDAGSGRLYFVRLQKSETGHAVRPVGETSWEAPAGFLTRHELVAKLSSALSQQTSGEGSIDDDVFLARVLARFPPPATPPPATAENKAAAALRNRVVELEEANETLRARCEAAEAEVAEAQRQAAQALSATGSGTSGAAAPPSLGAAQRPSWKRGVSQRFLSSDGLSVDQPPPPPPWALAKLQSGAGPFDLGSR